MTRILRTLWVAGTFLLAGCSHPLEFSMSFVCITGLCPTLKERLASIPWEPAVLGKDRCPDISGKYRYRDDGSLFIYFPESDPKGDSQLQIAFETIKRIPNSGYKEREAFDKAAVTHIQQDDKALTVYLTDPRGEVYQKKTIGLSSPMIGCHENAFFIRTLDGGNEGVAGYVSAIERKFSKTDDGSLQVIRSGREWYYSPTLGLMGMDARGEQNGDSPRESRYTRTFPPVQ